MKSLFGKAAGSVLLFLLCAGPMWAQSQDFKTGKSLDLFHGILREIAVSYVDTVQVDKLVETGIASILRSLDPYSEFIPEEDNESLELLVTGSYGGVGALVKQGPDGVILSEPYENSPAAKAGLVAGDCILEIDGDPIKGLSVDVCTSRMKGQPDTEVRFKVRKIRGGEIVDVVVRRERVRFPDISYAGLITPELGYIRISGFTQGGAHDFKKAFAELQQLKTMKALVLDLRGNGGGSLDEAVEMVGTFLPSHTEVVSAKGRYDQMETLYRTKEAPLDTHIPIAVLVDEHSASASEILAGAMQDLDRGIVLGTRTFGKGLVQSIRPLGYNAKLKMTTARYYIPSGRSVQELNYRDRSEDGRPGYTADSLRRAFKTRSGRTVYEGSGITPDVKVEEENYSRIAMDLHSRDILRDFAIDYYARHENASAPEDFILGSEEYLNFVDFAIDKGFDDRSATEIMLGQMMQMAGREQYDSLAMGQMEALKTLISEDKKDDLLRHEAELTQIIEAEISSLYYYQKGRYRSLLRQDPVLLKAMELLAQPGAYKNLLQGTVEETVESDINP
jgi:C-terminal peptidase (prc)